jgi:hypothetical protein
VRNLRPCVKVAIDFVSPENVGICVGMAARLRSLGCAADAALEPEERSNADKLQASAPKQLCLFLRRASSDTAGLLRFRRRQQSHVLLCELP